MSSFTASLSTIPNGTIVDLDAESDVSWFRARGIDPWHDSAWPSDFPLGWSFVPRAYSDPAATLGPIRSCGGRLPVGIGPSGDHVLQQISGTEPVGLMGHRFLNVQRIGDGLVRDATYPAPEPPAPLMREEAAPSAYTMTFHNGAEMSIGFVAQSIATEADFYFWFVSGSSLRWELQTWTGTIPALPYNPATHGSMTTNQLYRLRVGVPASTDTLLLVFKAATDPNTGQHGKIAFSASAIRKRVA